MRQGGGAGASIASPGPIDFGKIVVKASTMVFWWPFGNTYLRLRFAAEAVSVYLILLLVNWANVLVICDASQQVATKRKRRKVLCYEKRTRWN